MSKIKYFEQHDYNSIPYQRLAYCPFILKKNQDYTSLPNIHHSNQSPHYYDCLPPMIMMMIIIKTNTTTILSKTTTIILATFLALATHLPILIPEHGMVPGEHLAVEDGIVGCWPVAGHRSSNLHRLVKD